MLLSHEALLLPVSFGLLFNLFFSLLLLFFLAETEEAQDPALLLILFLGPGLIRNIDLPLLLLLFLVFLVRYMTIPDSFVG
jgi:hypothetical protein